MHADKIGLGRCAKLLRPDRCLPFNQSLSDTMHAVHDPTLCAEQDRVAEIGGTHQPRMVQNGAHARWVIEALKPVKWVRIDEGVAFNVNDRQSIRQRNEPLYIPRDPAFRA